METKDVRRWCSFMHLSQLAGYIIPFAGIIVPIVMWQTKKDQDPAIDEHGRMIVNALITYLLYFVVAGLLCFVLIGIPMVFALMICAVAFPIIGAIKAGDGILWRYPFVFRFV